jgi:hypothetical protein
MTGAVFTQVIPLTAGETIAVQACGAFLAIPVTVSTGGVTHAVVTKNFSGRAGYAFAVATRTGSTICC